MNSWELKCKTEEEVKEYSEKRGLVEELCRVLYVDTEGFLPFVKIEHPSMGSVENNPLFSLEGGRSKFKTIGENQTYRFNEWNEKMNKKNKGSEELDEVLVKMDRNRKFSWLSMNIHKYDIIEEEYWEHIRCGYQSCELGVMNHMDKEDVMITLSGGDSDFTHSEMMMNEKEMKKLKSLDDEVTIYRGISTEDDLSLNEYDLGISWTLSKKKGEWFGNRFPDNKYLLETNVEKRLILCYFNNMEEDEIIIDSCFITNEIKVTDLSSGDMDWVEGVIL